MSEEFMQPPFLNKFLPPKEKDDYFFLLEIFPDKIKAAACKIAKEEVDVLATAAKEAGDAWEETTLRIDEALSEVEKIFSQETTVNKVILGLPPEDVQDGKIKEEKLVMIRELCYKLSLTPIGFVEVPLAITYFLQKQEGGPQTLILIREGQRLAVSLIRVGKITNHTVVDRTDNVALDLEKALVSFADVEILPSKILLYDGQAEADLEKTRQTLMNYPWPTRTSFLHFPKIETATKDLDLKAIALAGASEMAQTIEIVKVEEKEKTVVEESGARAENFGFVKNQDIFEETPLVPRVTDESVIGQEVEFVPEETVTTPATKSSLFREKILAKIKLPSFKLPHLSATFRLKTFLGQKAKLLIAAVVGLLLLLSGGAAVALWSFPAAQVKIILESKILEQEAEITLNPKATAVNEAEKEIPGRLFEMEKKGIKKGKTTGKKLVGEPAKGEIVIYNKTANSKTLKKGTVLVSPNNFKFTLDEEVNVASASEGIGNLVFGKQNGRVTAEKIGPEGNLGVGQEFSFADFPTTSYSARNEVAFSGGTSRELSTVARIDQEKLIATLSVELTEQAKKDLQEKLTAGEKLLEGTLTSQVKSKKFNKEVDEEASEIELELSLSFTADGYKEDDLIAVLEKMIISSIPSGFEFRRNEVKMEISEVTKKKDGNLVFKMNFSASLLSKINETDIKKSLTGKTIDEADKMLRSLGNVAGFEVKFERKLPFGLDKNRLPRLSQNIQIETSSRQ